jgi:hypothetical protein
MIVSYKINLQWIILLDCTFISQNNNKFTEEN